MIDSRLPLRLFDSKHSLDLTAEHGHVWNWLLEDALTRIRWAAVPMNLLLIPIFSSLSIPLVVMFALMIGLGNAWMTSLLNGEQDLDRLRLAKQAATAIDWGIALMSIALYSPELSRWTPALLLFLILTVAVRYGQAGLVVAAVAASLTVTGLVLIETFVQDINEATVARDTWLGWMLLILVAASIVNGLVRAMTLYGQWQQNRWSHYTNVLPRFELGISKREWEILPLLTDDDMTYRQIADQLHLSPETIKTHVRHLGEKLGVSGRRHVVAEARRRGLLPSDSETESTHSGQQSLRVQPESHKG